MLCESSVICVKRGDALSVSAATCKVDVNCALKQKSKEPSPSTISTEASIGDDNNEKDLNVNKVLSATIGSSKIGYKLYWNIICPSPTEGATKNLGEVLHYLVMQSM